jgi:hypothetical protein
VFSWQGIQVPRGRDRDDVGDHEVWAARFEYNAFELVSNSVFGSLSEKRIVAGSVDSGELGEHVTFFLVVDPDIPIYLRYLEGCD